MNRRKTSWALLLAATALVFIFNCLLQVHGVRSTRVVIGRDAGDDNATAQGPELKSSYDACFTRANPISDHIN